MMKAIVSTPSSPPCLIVAHANASYASRIARGFRGLGWGVYLARNGPQARRLARIRKPDAVILQADLPEESGWLTCAKLTREHSLLRVVLVSDNLSPRNQDLAVFVGAGALIDRAGGLASLTDELSKTLCDRSILCHYSVPRIPQDFVKRSTLCSAPTLAGPSKYSWWRTVATTPG